MTRSTLILRSLAYHWRAHLAAGLAAAVGTAVLVGALLVGDSVRYSLKTMALERLGNVESALLAGDRFFKADLDVRMSSGESTKVFSSLIVIEGVCINDEKQSRANQVQILGVPPDFGRIGEHWPADELKKGEIFLNARLAAALNAKVGDAIRVRIYKPSLLSHDAPLGSEEKNAAVLRAAVKAILPDRGLGRFSFNANQIAPLNAYLPLNDVQEKIEQKGRANVLLALPNAPAPDAQLKKKWSLEDAQLRMRAEEKLRFIEISSPRVFLDESLTDQMLRDGGLGVTTYFVNALRANGKETPYSMVTAGTPPLVPKDTKDDEIVINEWEAEDLQARRGDKVEIEYFTVGLLRKLEKKTATFTVKDIVTINTVHADRELMPDFPGIADVDTTHDWDSSIPIDMKKIRQKDEDYWKKYRGTPKAFITLKRGVELWQNRFGKYTAMRFVFEGDPELAKEALAVRIRQTIDPAKVGLSFVPVRSLALQASGQAIDFGMLFLGFSFFLIAAAVLLMALIYQFNIESRAIENGVLLALGAAPTAVRNILWYEGLFTATLGSALGTFGGNFYAKAMLDALATRWRAAVGTSALEFHAEPLSLLIGFLSGVAIAALAIFLAVRRQASLPARQLLASGGAELQSGERPGHFWSYAGIACFAGALGIVAVALRSAESSAAQAFFGAGGLLLLAALSAVRLLLADSNAPSTAQPGTSAFIELLRLGVRSASRRSKRSLATAALLACGSFLVVAVGANKLDATLDGARKESGTGGFALFARSTIPIFEDLNSAEGRTNAGIPDEGLADATLFPLRVKAGDEASCLNLNRAQKPRILGISDKMIERGGFSFAARIAGIGDPAQPWTMLKQREGSTLYGICDFQSLTWALGKKVGDTIQVTDENGAERSIKIVGAVANSILQGSILISEESFLELYPSESGYREFLIDAPSDRIAAVKSFLERSLQDDGFTATPAVQRLAEFNAVQNTYLSTFQALGALGMLLGSLGLGIVVMRNVLERRSELAVLRAIGFSHLSLGWLVLSEHLWLLVLGLGAGVIAALIAVAPQIGSTSMPLPTASIAVSLGLILACGLFSAVAATLGMLRTPLLAALRNE
ncbi:MAG TPA: ABC transporter permease [Planctomycetota bacterium]|nr:ABC transporter permease [Planctomycetota bacterium]